MNPHPNRSPGGTRNGRRTGLALSAAACLALTTVTPSAAAELAGQWHSRFDVAPGSPVLISEIAAGGAGATTQANRDGNKNFIELTNYSDEPVDISDWRIYRCGQAGSGYGPQAIVPAGTVLAPGDQYTTAGMNSGYDVDILHETNLHAFGYGAFIQDADGQRQDAIGLYHPEILNDCQSADGQWLSRGLQHRLDESHQRVSNTGDVERDWVIAPRTVDAPNRTEWDVAPRIDNGLRFSEFNSGGRAGSDAQYVEVTNYGTEPVDMTDYQLFRCGDNGSQYLQIGAVDGGTVLNPGESWVAAREGGAYAEAANMTYPTSMHWRNFGVLLVTPGEEIVDSASVYDNRMSSCDNGLPIAENLNHFDDTTYQRVADTGNAAEDFIVTATRTPGTDDRSTGFAPAPRWEGYRDLRISEVAPAGPAGGDDEFFELANYGSQPVSLAGYSVHRCYGTGQPGAGAAQIEDLGDVTLQPGEVYLGVAAGAPTDLLVRADGVYEVGLNAGEGYGLYVSDPSGARVDSFASYDDNQEQYRPCALGEEARNWTKNDQGESYTRAQFLGDNELDFQPAARTPGVLADTTYVDPVVPLPGELDPVEVPTDRVPGTPAVSGAGPEFTVNTSDEGGTSLDVTAWSAELRDTEGSSVWSGTTDQAVPTAAPGAAEGEEQVRDAATAAVTGNGGSHPYLRFEVPMTDAGRFVWSGTTEARNELQLLVWHAADGVWGPADAAAPSTDGAVTLVGDVPAEAVTEGVAHVMVIDGPRTTGGLLDEVGVRDLAFPDPGRYDVALNHMSDTQFLSEGFRDVFRKQASWVVANEDARKIGYNSLTGDIIENWMNGNHAVERADREYRAAQDILDLITEAGIPNGVLPGNHDNMWGHSNEKFNDYFPAEMFEPYSWFGEPWAPGDNSAHTSYFSAAGVDFLVVSLPYRPTTAQMTWAREQAAAHPEHDVILATHSYLHTSGDRDDMNRRYTGNGDEMWEQVVAPSPNIFLVFGGHYHGISTMGADPITGERLDVTPVNDETTVVGNVGAEGRTVVEMLADYQGYRSTQVDGDPTITRGDLLDRDTGFQRLLAFDVDAGLMAVNAYSPHLDSFEAWKYDEPAFRGANARYEHSDEEFVVAIDLTARSTTLTSTGWALTAPAAETVTATASPDTSVSLAVPGHGEGTLLVVEVADADGNVVRVAPALAVGGDGSDDIPVNAEIPGVGGPGGPGEPGSPGGPGDPGDPGEPGEPLPGALALSVAEGTLELGGARNRGTHLALSGRLPQVTVTDSRQGAGGWDVIGAASDLSSGDAVVRAQHLGWEPFVVDGPATPGPAVAPAPSGGSGLSVPAALGGDAGTTGSSVLGADVALVVPVDTTAGAYRGAVTVSLFPRD